MYFPAAGTLAQGHDPAPPQAPRTGHETVLGVEDAQAVRSVLCQILSLAGYQVSQLQMVRRRGAWHRASTVPFTW